MVSKARLDFPEPDNPVMTTRLSRGISTEMFFRLWTRAPWTATVVRAVDLALRVIEIETWADTRGQQRESGSLALTRIPAIRRDAVPRFAIVRFRPHRS